jgi:hypothetical protein
VSEGTNKGDVESLEAKAHISQSAQPIELHIGFVPQPVDGVQVDLSVVRNAFDDIPKLLVQWEDVIVQKTNDLLQANEAKLNSDCDAIFAFHTNYVDFCIKSRIVQRARNLWRERIAPIVDASELRLRTTNPTARIHRGAPLYNTGLCSFVLGDFDRALQYIAEAGCHDEGFGRGNRIKILIGDHPLSQYVIINPLENFFTTVWGPDYAAITGYTLDGTELKRLLLSMADRPADAIQAVIALHRLTRTISGPQNHGTSVVRFRAFADLLHLVESFLRQFQTAVTGQLDDHLNCLVNANPATNTARTIFRRDRKAWATAAGCDCNSSDAMNWISNETGTRISSSRTPASATGIVIFFCHQFRNSLLHVNEESLSIFRNEEECLKAAGWVLGMLRNCARAKEGKFSPADFP